MPPENFYDEEMKLYVSKLPTEDRQGLLESIFNSLANTMGAYYRQLGHSDREIEMLIKTEIDSIKEMIRKRTDQFPDPMDVEVGDGVIEGHEVNPCVDVTAIVDDAPRFDNATDDQFDNDTAIDLGQILAEFGVRE